MNTVIFNSTVADYCEAMKRGEVVVNRDYQRSEHVWPPAARSYLIETVLLGYPMPKFSLRQVTDLKSKKTFKEIVDGQQRSIALSDFYNDRLRLSRGLETEEIAGKTYSGLEDEFKERFLGYQLNADLVVAATDEEVRQMFRRINSYTVPLNPEEQRHALYQGVFKWFIHKLAQRLDQSFVNMGIFREKQLVRMADMKLLTEICHALRDGIETTKRKDLDKLYENGDEAFPEEGEFGRRLREAFEQVVEWPQIHRTPLMRPHVVYALILAVTHCRRKVDSLEPVYSSPRTKDFADDLVQVNLASLSEALEDPENAGKLRPFVDSCSGKTNVREQRQQRFIWLCKALGPKKI
jgi:hypothetical protein